MKSVKIMVAALVMTAGLVSKATAASAIYENASLIQRDSSYEQALKYEASADKTITPAKVFRWIRGFRGQVVAAPSIAEFQPIVNAHDGHVRLIAAIAFKF